MKLCSICGLDNLIDEICQNCQSPITSEIKEHNEKLIEAKVKTDYKGMKVLIFNPCACGDNAQSSLGPELMQIKYPGCTVDFWTSTYESIPILQSNPFINKAILSPKWEDFRLRQSEDEVREGIPARLGETAKEYDVSYGLYWWDALPQIKSFLEDLELPTEYQHVRIYTTSKEVKKAHFVWNNGLGMSGGYKIAVQIENAKWEKGTRYAELKEGLKKFGTVLELGKREGYSYLDDAEIIRQADLMVCTTGSIEHVSAAVGTQTVTISPVYNPEANCVAYYQNKYMPTNKQHVLVRPKDWCGNYACITENPDELIYKTPPYGFNPDRFPPHMVRDCNYGGFKKSCIHEIKVQDILEKVEQALSLRVKQ